MNDQDKTNILHINREDIMIINIVSIMKTILSCVLIYQWDKYPTTMK